MAAIDMSATFELARALKDRLDAEEFEQLLSGQTSSVWDRLATTIDRSRINSVLRLSRRESPTALEMLRAQHTIAEIRGKYDDA